MTVPVTMYLCVIVNRNGVLFILLLTIDKERDKDQTNMWMSVQ